MLHVVCWWFTIHNTLSNIFCVGGKPCYVGGLPCTTHFQTYFVLEVNHAMLVVYHAQHTFKHIL